MRREKKPTSGRVRFDSPISVAWYWLGDQIDGPGKVEWRLYCCSSTWGCPSFQGTRPCLRKNAEAVALLAASGRAEELARRLIEAADAMVSMSVEVTP